MINLTVHYHNRSVKFPVAIPQIFTPEWIGVPSRLISGVFRNHLEGLVIGGLLGSGAEVEHFLLDHVEECKVNVIPIRRVCERFESFTFGDMGSLFITGFEWEPLVLREVWMEEVEFKTGDVLSFRSIGQMAIGDIGGCCDGHDVDGETPLSFPVEYGNGRLPLDALIEMWLPKYGESDENGSLVGHWFHFYLLDEKGNRTHVASPYDQHFGGFVEISK